MESQLRREFTTSGDREFVIRGRADLASVPILAEDEQGCVDVGLEVDGRPVPVRLGPVGLAGRTSFRACGLVPMAPGRHRAEGAGAATVDSLELTSGAARPTPAPPSVEVEASGSDARRVFEITGTGPERVGVVSGDAFDERWRLSNDGRDLGSPVMVDIQNTWLVEARPGQRFDAWFRPARLFRAGLIVTGTGLVLCLAILLRSVRPRRRP